MLLAAAALLAASQARSYVPAGREISPRLELVAFTGQIQVKATSPLKRLPGGETPAILPGSEVIILSGSAIFQSTDLFIHAKQGDAFVFHVPLPIGDSGRPLLLIGTGERTALDLRVGDARATLPTGAALLVRSEGGGEDRIESAMGKVEFTRGGRAVTLKAGDWARCRVASTAPAPLTPEEREELRAAPR